MIKDLKKIFMLVPAMKGKKEEKPSGPIFKAVMKRINQKKI